MSVVDHAQPHRLVFKMHKMFMFRLYLFLNKKYTWLCSNFDKVTEINKKLRRIRLRAILLMRMPVLTNQQSRYSVHTIDLIAKPGKLLSNENAAYIDV